MHMPTEKTREDRLRRQLDRRGYALQKSAARDPHSLTSGGYQIIDLQTRGLVAGWGNANRGYAFSLDDVQSWLTEGGVE
jgi:hypothetical protein